MARFPHRDRTYRLVNRLGAALYTLFGLRISVRGGDHIPMHGPAVIVCNHISYIDFTLIGYAARRRGRFVRFMCKRKIFDNRFAGPPMRAMRHLPVDRPSGAVAYRTGRDRLRDDEVICVFPEATISHSFVLRPFKEGAAALAIDRGTALIPTIGWGSQRIAGTSGNRRLRRGRAVSIIIGEPILPGAGETRASLTLRLRSRMAELLDEAIDTYPQTPVDDSDRWWIPHHKGGTAPDIDTGLRLDLEGLERIGESID